MARFANAGPALGGETGWPSLFWLAGLLEGEGTFLKPVPSDPGSPIISCRMTDLDVIEMVAALFGTSVQANDKGSYKTEYSTTIRGSRCVELMRILRPMMGGRRRQAIDRAVEGYQAPAYYKLSYERAEEIRARLRDGESVDSLARTYGVVGRTIRQVRGRDTYKTPSRFPWIPIARELRGATAAGTGLSWAEMYWLAGWLEGEGSFLCPPPSSPRQVRISASSIDEDVIGEAARLLRRPARLRTEQRRPEWTPLWRVVLNGGRAAVLMQAIAPVMGVRRSKQIARALTVARDAGAKLGWHENPSNRCHSDDRVLGLEVEE